MALLWWTKLVKFSDVKGLESVAWVGKSVDAVNGASTSGDVSI